jgi:hypothetical protein
MSLFGHVVTVKTEHLEASRMARDDSDGDARVADGDRDGIAKPQAGADEQ